MIMTEEYILCAAIKLKLEYIIEEAVRITYKDMSCWVKHGKIDDIYCIETGRRHPDILSKHWGRVSAKANDQGFYTSYGRFVDREEAAKIAFEVGQITKKKRLLYSEDLY